MSKRILIVAAHPDDEVLGVGGTIIRHAKKGDKVKILLMAEGLTSRAAQRNVKGFQAEFDILHENAARVAQTLGAESIRFFNFPDNRMDGVERLDVVKAIESEIDDFRPEVVYTYHSGDVNIDHL